MSNQFLERTIIAIIIFIKNKKKTKLIGLYYLNCLNNWKTGLFATNRKY